jgi:CheY-like chemotaxis protein
VIETYETILAVEDEDDDVALLKRAFRKVGIVNPVTFLADGEAAVQYLAGEGGFADRAAHPLPALVLLDLKLPRKSGLDVLAWLREQPAVRRIPVVVLTSSRQNRDLERAYDLGANSYLVKPVEFADLVSMIEALRLYWIVFNETPPASQAG